MFWLQQDQKSPPDDPGPYSVLQLGLTEPGADVRTLSKPTIADLGGACLNRAIASSMALALTLSGLVLATRRAQQWTQAKL